MRTDSLVYVDPTPYTGLHLHYGDLTDSSSLVKLIGEVGNTYVG